MLNVSGYINPIRLRSISGDLAGQRARVSGWGLTSDSKYNFLIISHFKLKVSHNRMAVSKGRNSWHSEHFAVTVNTFNLYHVIQCVRTVQGCMAVLYELANRCYIYIKSSL
jgi:hypothetical protein